MSSVQPAILPGIQIVGSSSNYTSAWLIDNGIHLYHLPQLLRSTVIVDRVDRCPRFISDVLGAFKVAGLGGEKRTTDEASLAEERTPIPHCCAHFARLWGTATPLYHVHSLHSQDYFNSLQSEQTHPLSTLHDHEMSEKLSEELEMRINRNIEHLLREDATTDMEHKETLVASNLFHYGSDLAEYELKKKREGHAKECTYVDSVASDLNKRYAEDVEIIKFLFEKLSELEE